MEILIEQLVEAIKAEPCYKDYLTCHDNLMKEPIHSMLLEYQQALVDYNESRKYHKYANFDDSKLALHTLKKQVSEQIEVVHYYKAYHALQKHLEQITHIVFDDISPSLFKGGFML